MRPTDLIDEPRSFDTSRLFYSRTDKRGVIQSGNLMFADVSGYDGAQMAGAPHKIVRHPDMPRAAFAMMWRMLADDIPVGVYVKNLASDGRYYWVFAVVLPTPTGYISVRMHPRGPHFETIRGIYARLRAAEAEKTDLDAELLRLDEELQKAGFADYVQFMAAAMVAEATAMPANTASIAQGGPLDRLLTLQKKLNVLKAAQDELLATFRTLYLIPTNMRILASRLEPSGGPVSAISDSYKRTATELMQRLRGTNGQQHGSTRELIGQVDFTIFEAFSARVLRLAAQQFRGEQIFGRAEDGLSEPDLIIAHCEHGEDARSTKMDGVGLRVQRVRHDAESFQRLMAGLDQVRILGEVESGRLRHHDGGLAAIMAQLEEFHGRIRERLSAMITLTAQMDATG